MKPVVMRRWLQALKLCVSQLTKEFDMLVGATLVSVFTTSTRLKLNNSCVLQWIKPLNKGHVGDNINSAVLSFVERLSSFGGSKCIRAIGRTMFGTSAYVLCREVYYTVFLSQRVHCRRYGQEVLYGCYYYMCMFVCMYYTRSVSNNAFQTYTEGMELCLLMSFTGN